jgi:hypothetical protein
MDGWMDGWMVGWMDDEWMDVWLDGWLFVLSELGLSIIFTIWYSI